jgi:hypothetical protein
MNFVTGNPRWSGVRWLALLLLLSAAVHVQAQSGSATLTISLSVQSSVSLVFQDNPSVGSTGFCPLTNAGTNNVGLDFGTASWTGGASLACVAYSHVGPATYQVASGFDVVVTKFNTSSPNYNLRAKISSTPPNNVTWLINNVVMSTAFATLDNADVYATPKTKTLQVQVKNSVAPQTLLETITFLATAN